MYLKLLILLIPFTVNFVSCFKNFIYFVQHYNEIRSNAQSIHELNAIMCKDMETKSKTKYQVCQRVFKLLRDDTAKNNPYKHSIYINYDAFNLSLIDPEYPVCQEKNIRVLQEQADKFLSLNCYGQPPIRSETSEDNKYLKEISVFYGPDRGLIVLQCHESNVDCELLEWYNYNEWHQFSDIPNYVLNIPTPQYASIQKLKFAFHENLDSIKYRNSRLTESHFLHKKNVNKETLNELCDLLLENHEYKNKYKYTIYRQTSRAYPFDITIFEQPPVENKDPHKKTKDIPKVKVSLKGHTCSRYRYKPGKDMAMYFKIIPGLNETSVILIEPIIYQNEKYFVPGALIENFNWVYVLNRENWF